MFETLTLLAFASPFLHKLIQEEISHRQIAAQHAKRPAPGLSSQAAQIKPVAPSKQPYLGPKRPRSAEFYRNRRTKKAIRKLPF